MNKTFPLCVRKRSLALIGDPSLSIDESPYLLDFKPHFFKSRNRISLKINKTMVEMYKKGQSLMEIARLFDCSKHKVRVELKKAKVKTRQSPTQSTHLRRLKLGKQGALLYYGFCYFEGHITKDHREFPILSKIHSLWERGDTIHQITQSLNKNKLPSRHGKTWSWAAVQNIVERFKQKKLILKKGGEYEFR